MARQVELRVLIDLDEPLGPQIAAAKPFISWKLLEDMTGYSRQQLDRLRAGARRWRNDIVSVRRVDVFVNDGGEGGA